MDELEISGRRYISSVRAAKEHKYHSDYIGQLVRGGKVAGQKVGRAWYVDADSLSEYLGKEVPARGPVVKKQKPEPEPKPVKEKIVATTVEETVVEAEESEPTFVMPLRKSGRQHVIEAINSVPVKKTAKQTAPPPVVEVFEEKNEEPEELEVFTMEVPQEVAEEEETFIPLKITKEPAHQAYSEPEDSFYKVSSKGLRYIDRRTPMAAYENKKETVAPRTAARGKQVAARVAKAVSLVLAAGILSLGAGILMSYYLHSITTVQESGQTSSVILSN